MSARIAYDFAVLRAVPHPHLEWWAPVGVVVHARTTDFLGAKALLAENELALRVPGVDPALLARYLRAWVSIALGEEAAGPVALLPPSERFHWLICPRSDVLQCSRAHPGITDDPAEVLERLWHERVASSPPRLEEHP